MTMKQMQPQMKPKVFSQHSLILAIFNLQKSNCKVIFKHHHQKIEKKKTYQFLHNKGCCLERLDRTNDLNSLTYVTNEDDFKTCCKLKDHAAFLIQIRPTLPALKQLASVAFFGHW